MIFTTRSQSICAVFIPLVLFIGGVLGRNVHHVQLEISSQETSINFNADLMHLSSFGLNSSLADLVWMQTLIESDLEHYRGTKLDSWMFHRFNLISTLDPFFYENYLYGGQYLMIVKDDLDGADKLFRKGLQIFPDDMSLNWHMGYLWAYEKGDVSAAYPFFKKVSTHPNRPPMFDTIFARLSVQAMGRQEAYDFAYESWKQHADDSPVKSRLGQVLYSLKAEIDLECLNMGGANCSTEDFDGDRYIKQKGAWISSKPLLKTHLNIRKKNKSQ